MKRILLAALLGTVALAPAAHASTSHCDGHNSPDVVKVEGRNNDFVPPDGMEFCVKASTQTTGRQTGDGTTPLIAFVEAAGIMNDNDQPHDVSYYVVYNAAGEGAENSQPPVPADDDEEYDDGDDKAKETEPTTSATVESDVKADELGDCEIDGKEADGCDTAAEQDGVEATVRAASGDTAADTTGGATAAGVETPVNTASGTTPTEPQTEVRGETLERGPSALARTGAGVGGLATLGGLLCAGGFVARRFLGLW